jgi:GNAT superfamily N-acetyltransferase
VAGISLGVLREVKVRDRILPGRQAAYSAVHPDYRGLGLSRDFVIWRDQTLPYDLTLDFTQVAQLVHNRERRGTRQSGNPLSIFVRVLSARGAARERGRERWRALPGYAALAVRSRLRRFRLRGLARPPFRVRSIDAFDSRVDRLFEVAAAPFELIPVRNAAFLNWRYLDGRIGWFTALVAEEEGELLGYAVFRLVGTRAHLADVLVMPGRSDVLRALLDRAVGLSGRHGASAVECTMMLHHPYTPALKAAGFVRVKRRSEEIAHKFGVNPAKIDPTEIDFVQAPDVAIHIVEGDSDLI